MGLASIGGTHEATRRTGRQRSFRSLAAPGLQQYRGRRIRGFVGGSVPMWNVTRPAPRIRSPGNASLSLPPPGRWDVETGRKPSNFGVLARSQVAARPDATGINAIRSAT